MHINERGKAHFAEVALDVTIELEQPDFCAEFNRRTKSWTVLWKWSGDQPPEKLYNREYAILARACAERATEPD